MSAVRTAMQTLWRDTLGRWTAVVGLALLLPLYAFMLPASLTGGYIGWVSLRLLTPGMAAIALVLSILLSLTLALALALTVMLVRRGPRASKSVAAGGAVIALVTPMLCRTPLLPLALGAAALALPALTGVGAGPVQGFIATHESALLVFAVVLSGVAFLLNARKLAHGPSCRAPSHPAE